MDIRDCFACFSLVDLRQTLHFKLASDVKTQVSRRSAMDDLLKHYENETVTSSRIHVTFNNEIGEDHGGLTQDLFSAFWDQAFEKFFDGDVVKVPFVPPSDLQSVRGTFETMRRTFSQGYMVTSAILVGFLFWTNAPERFFK